jgi:carbon monoxide dehydrogenase subunit G
VAIPTRAEERIEIHAPPDHVYGMVADLTRMGEWSPECYRVEWVGGATGPEVGAEFLGHNRIGPYRWSVGGKVVAADRAEEFAFTTYAHGRESTRWRYHLEPSGEGTILTEGYEFVWATPFIRLGDRLMPRRRMLQRGMRQTLRRIKARAETG